MGRELLIMIVQKSADPRALAQLGIKPSVKNVTALKKFIHDDCVHIAGFHSGYKQEADLVVWNDIPIVANSYSTILRVPFNDKMTIIDELKRRGLFIFSTKVSLPTDEETKIFANVGIK